MSKVFISVNELLQHYTNVYNAVHFCFSKNENTRQMKLHLTMEDNSTKTISFELVGKCLHIIED